MTRKPTHPNFGHEARVEVFGSEVRLTFVASSNEKANDLADTILAQLREGNLTLRLRGRPTSVEEGERP